MQPAIHIEGLTKHYGQRRVVDRLTLDVPTGSIYGLLGRNGAGKSTLIKMLVGLVQPDVGAAELLGQSIVDLDPAIRSRVAYLAEGHPLYRWMTVRQAERFSRAFYPDWHAEIFAETLAHFKIAESAKIGKLSNGQRAQVSLALALAPDPELLILDDPTLGLDTVVRRDFLESLILLIQRRGRTILFSSHILADVERLADRIGVIVDGVLRVDCPTERFKEAVRRVILRFASSLARFPDCPGLVSQRAIGQDMELVVVNWSDTHQELAESLGATSIELIEMNLEDAFIAYTRGHSAPLPSFVNETLPC